MEVLLTGFQGDTSTLNQFIAFFCIQCMIMWSSLQSYSGFFCMIRRSIGLTYIVLLSVVLVKFFATGDSIWSSKIHYEMFHYLFCPNNDSILLNKYRQRKLFLLFLSISITLLWFAKHDDYFPIVAYLLSFYLNNWRYQPNNFIQIWEVYGKFILLNLYLQISTFRIKSIFIEVYRNSTFY